MLTKTRRLSQSSILPRYAAVLLLLAICSVLIATFAQNPPDMHYLLKRAKQGYADEQFQVGRAFEMGIGVKRDQKTAAEWFARAAGAGDFRAQTELASMYLNGIGVRRDDQNAVHLLQQAAASGYAPGQFQLGTLYLLGRGIKRDDSEGVRWITRAALSDYAPAEVNLGIVYWNAIPAEQEKAIRLFQKAAGQHFEAAEFILGGLYETGSGVPKDFAAAAAWYGKAAEQGFAPAQNNLGILYHDGNGVPRDLSKAINWYRRAAEQRNPAACMNLAKVYGGRSNSSPNYSLAYFWVQIGRRSAADQQSTSNTFFESVRGQLKPQELLQLDSQIEDWINSHPIPLRSVQFTDFPNDSSLLRLAQR